MWKILVSLTARRVNGWTKHKVRLNIIHCLASFLVRKPGGEQRQIDKGSVKFGRSSEATYKTRGFYTWKEEELTAEFNSELDVAEWNTGAEKVWLRSPQSWGHLCLLFPGLFFVDLRVSCPRKNLQVDRFWKNTQQATKSVPKELISWYADRKLCLIKQPAFFALFT